jgi:hypothetical protein
MYSEGVLFLKLIKEMEYLRAIDLSLSEQSIYNYNNTNSKKIGSFKKENNQVFKVT